MGPDYAMHIPQLQHGTILRVYIEILSQFACQEDTFSCRADPKVASPVPDQFSLDSHFGHPETQDDTATFQCLPSPCCGC